MLASLSLYANDIYLYLTHQSPGAPWVLGLKGLPFLAGAVLFYKSRALAVRFTKDLE